MFKHGCILLVTILSLSGCKKNDEATSDTISNVLETAMSEAGGASSSAEGASSPLANSLASPLVGLDFVDPQDGGRHSIAACTFSGVRSACSGSVITATWSGCTIGTITMSGGWTETFNSATACTNFSGGGGLANNSDWIQRTTSSSVATFASGATLTLDSSGGTAYDGTTMNANGVKITRNSATARTVLVDSVHRVLRGPLGRKWFDHYLSGTVTVSGTRAGGDRVISGSLTVYHQLIQYTAANTFNNVTWGSSSCCYPTSGNISATLTGNVTGTATLAFSSTCGSATFTDTAGASSTVTLTQCQ